MSRAPRLGFTLTYEIVTPESAEHGDAAECGFIDAHGSKCDERPAPLTLRDVERVGFGCCEDSGDWFTETDSRENYATGESTRYSLHPPDNITASSYNRLARLLGAYQGMNKS